ncbi:MAG: hypothetical protein ABW221_10840 [Vicinamibacteria bacterium]
MERPIGWIVVGITLGAWHLSLALSALFVFGQEESLAAWLLIVSLAITCPGSLAALWHGRTGSTLLAIGLALGVPIAATDLTTSQALAWALAIVGPQGLLAWSFWHSARSDVNKGRS